MRLLPLAAVLATLASPALADQLEVSVSGLTCPSCSFIAGRSIDALDGAEVLGFEPGAGGTGTFAVTYDSSVVTPAAIEAAVEANGYPATIDTPAS